MYLMLSYINWYQL